MTTAPTRKLRRPRPELGWGRIDTVETSGTESLRTWCEPGEMEGKPSWERVTIPAIPAPRLHKRTQQVWCDMILQGYRLLGKSK